MPDAMDVAIDTAIAELARELGPLSNVQRIDVSRILERMAKEVEYVTCAHCQYRYD